MLVRRRWRSETCGEPQPVTHLYTMTTKIYAHTRSIHHINNQTHPALKALSALRNVIILGFGLTDDVMDGNVDFQESVWKVYYKCSISRLCATHKSDI